MTIVKRIEKGIKLTISELDGNFDHINSILTESAPKQTVIDSTTIIKGNVYTTGSWDTTGSLSYYPLTYKDSNDNYINVTASYGYSYNINAMITVTYGVDNSFIGNSIHSDLISNSTYDPGINPKWLSSSKTAAPSNPYFYLDSIDDQLCLTTSTASIEDSFINYTLLQYSGSSGSV
jgi:hypothetical protein